MATKPLKYTARSCIISFFYIKPQQVGFCRPTLEVVLYPSSTSNHNTTCPRYVKVKVVLYPSSTSNHNKGQELELFKRLCYILLLHQTTTYQRKALQVACCVISFFYIKPQRERENPRKYPSCVISFFYIKPQLWLYTPLRRVRCVISFFYIKPQQPD